MGGGALISAGAALAAALVVAAAGGGDAFWLSVPVALLLAARGGSALETGGSTLLVAAACAVPGRPSLPVAALVLGGSTLVMHRVRSRLDADRVRLRSSALTDPLTGVANRRALAERVEYEVARHRRGGHAFAVVALDLDGFKLVNDRFGHPAGDEVLVDVAAALRGAVREQDTVARAGGDEFCVLAPETDDAGAEQLADRVERSVQSATAGLAGLGASVGVALYPRDADHAAALLEAADANQVAAKRLRRRGAAAVRRAA